MTNLLWYNNGQTTLGAPVVPGATIITLAAGAGSLFTPGPTGTQYFVATFTDAATGLINEIVHVTNVSGDVLTIVRAQEGTSALTWQVGDNFGNLITAGALATIETEAAPTADKWTTARTLSFTGDVTGTGSVDGSANVAFPMTGVQAAKLTTARTLAMTGDASWTVTFDGSVAVTAAGTLATVNLAPGVTGDATHVAQVTTNGKGLVTAQASVAIQSATTAQPGLAQLVSTAVDATLADATKALTAAAIATLMPQALGASGHVQLPGGLIVQWGTVAIAVAAVDHLIQTMTFPVAFPTGAYGGVTTCQENTSFIPANAGANWVAIMYGFTTLGASIRIDTESGGTPTGTVHVFYIVLGH